ncbi:MAG: NADPH-dependent glutamate synthase [Kineosporiaceae bacterium]|nr:NADPH-dependent glutamate synthase [Kineosporiaceae bacterium]
MRTIPQERTPVREQDPAERARNFTEVSLGYNETEAIREAQRCLDCADPVCIAGCPVSIDIPGFIRKVNEGDYRGAYDTIAASNLLPAVCGRVCPQENQCEGVCTVADTLEPVAIGRLERFIGDLAITQNWARPPHITPTDHRVAIVGSGPAGMACAADLAKAGCDVTVFEALHLPGGVLRYGIPDFRLPNAVIDAEIANLQQLGVTFITNTVVGRLFTIEDMVTELGFDAVFIGTGAGYPTMLGIPGDSLNGVLSANELLTRANLMHARDFPTYDTPIPLGRHVAVVGAGNTAMDAMRMCLRLGAENVHCIYRRSRDEAPARVEEVHHAEQEGVQFHWLTNPVAILDDGRGGVRGMRCVQMELGEADDSGRRRPAPVPGSEFEFACDQVVFAIGTNANPIIGQTSRLSLNRRGYLEVDQDLATSIAGVYAGGDIVTGAATVIEAMGAGRRAAAAITRYLAIRDPGRRYREGGEPVFGMPAAERNFAPLRLATVPADPLPGDEATGTTERTSAP